MSTIKIVQKKDKVNKKGLCPVVIRITDNRKVRYYSTGITIPPSAWDEHNQTIRIDSEYFHLQRNIDAARQKAASALADKEQVVVSPVRTSTPTVKVSFLKEMEVLSAKGKVGTGIKYRYCLQLLDKAGLSDVKINRIDRDYLNSFDAFLIQRGNNNNSRATKFSVLRAVYNKARLEGIRMPDIDPFDAFKPGRLWKATRKRALNKLDVVRIMNLNIEFSSNPYSLSFARDIFVFSYLIGGINFRDIATLKSSNIIEGRVCYCRHKTGKELGFVLQPSALKILRCYRQDDGDGNQYIFPILDYRRHITNQQIHNRVHKVLGHVNRNLKKVAAMVGIECSMTTYVARHSFATVLKREGVSISIISEAMGHRDVATTEIYLDSFYDKQKDSAMEKLL